MKQIIKRFAGCCMGLLWVLCLAAQPALTRVEYYIDTDPGYGNATAISFTAGSTNLINAALNINPSSVSTGVHVLGIRAKDANGAWSQDNRWLFARPYSTDTTGPGTLPAISRVEYYIDSDPGYGSATAVGFTAGSTNLSNIALNINPATITQGVHVLGIRTKDVNGAWSQDNRWLFARPYASDTTTPGPLPNVTRVEYYIDSDPGYGSATPVNITSGVNLSNLAVNIDTSTVTRGVHVLGIRAKDANGAWSQDNRWLFARPYANDTTAPGTVPNLKQVEYYIDTDPGYGKGVQLAMENVSNLSNFNLSVNISGLSVAAHILFIRSKDANNAWSLDNKFDFTVFSAAAASSIVVNSISKKTLCAGASFSVGYEAKGTYNPANIFTAQLSSSTGSFATPTVIGTLTSKVSGIITCTLPGTLITGTQYKIRVISSTPSLTGISSDAIAINALPATPTITPSGATTFCQGGSVTLTSTAATTYLWSNGANTQSIIVTIAGNYNVTVGNGAGCTATSSAVTVTVNPLPTATVTASHPPINLCPGTTDTLTASAGSSYLWSNSATTASIIVTAAGNYSVTVTNSFGCSASSAATVVTYLGCAKPAGLKATVTSSTKATLKWKAATCGTQYQLQYRPVSTATWTTVAVPALTYKVSNLLPATTYEWQVATVCQISPQILSAYTVGTNFTTTASPDSFIATTDVQQTDASFNVVVFPNPAHSNTVLRISGTAESVSIKLTEISGKILWQSPFIKETQVSLPVEKLAAGVYMVIVNNVKQTRFVKLVIE